MILNKEIDNAISYSGLTRKASNSHSVNTDGSYGPLSRSTLRKLILYEIIYHDSCKFSNSFAHEMTMHYSHFPHRREINYSTSIAYFLLLEALPFFNSTVTVHDIVSQFQLIPPSPSTPATPSQSHPVIFTKRLFIKILPHLTLQQLVQYHRRLFIFDLFKNLLFITAQTQIIFFINNLLPGHNKIFWVRSVSFFASRFLNFSTIS